MKRSLNPSLKNEIIIHVNESNSEEDTNSKEMEEIFSQGKHLNFSRVANKRIC